MASVLFFIFLPEDLLVFLQFRSDDEVAVRFCFISVVIVLMVVLSLVEIGEWFDGRHDGVGECSAFIKFGFEELRLFPLFVVMEEYDTPILGTYIIALPIEGGGVMGLPEDFQQLVDGYFRWVIYQLAYFSMAGVFFADLLVGGVHDMSATVTAGDFQHPFHLLEDGLGAPKAA